MFFCLDNCMDLRMWEVGGSGNLMFSLHVKVQTGSSVAKKSSPVAQKSSSAAQIIPSSHQSSHLHNSPKSRGADKSTAQYKHMPEKRLKPTRNTLGKVPRHAVQHLPRRRPSGRCRQACLGASRASFEPVRDAFLAGACIEQCIFEKNCSFD